MKKIIIFAAAILAAIAFCSCKSQPVEPDIIGTGIVQSTPESDAFYVELDGNYYPIESVTVLKQKPTDSNRWEKVAPVKGVEVTIFSSVRYKGIQAVLGEQNSEQIEELYLNNYTANVLFFIFLMVLALLIGFGCSKNADTCRR